MYKIVYIKFGTNPQIVFWGSGSVVVISAATANFSFESSPKITLVFICNIYSL